MEDEPSRPSGATGEETAIANVTVLNVGSDPSHLVPLATLVADGKLRAAIRRTYPLADAAQAIVDFTNDHTLGKLVIEMPGA